MAESLRDQLSANLETLEQEKAADQPPVTGKAAPSSSAGGETASATAASAEQTKPGRTDGRARDEHGRLLPGKPLKTSAPATEKAITTPNVGPASAPAAEIKARPKYPSTWKKDFQEHFDKADQTFAEYLLQREGEYAKGVSTYKGEWEKAKPLLDAITPYSADLQRFGIDPATHVKNLFGAHQRLALGSPEEKLQMFAALARDYQVPLGGLFVRDQQGQVFLNQQLLAAPQQSQRQQPVDIRQQVAAVLSEERAKQELDRFSNDAEKYPHFAVVKETMAGLLQAGLADDYASAYDAALRHPRHADLFEAQQKLARETEERRIAEEKRKQAETARRNTVSTRTATPTSQGQGSGAKGLRAQLEENLDAIAAGRV